MIVFLVCAAIFLINIFFGYWRANTRRFSLSWIMSIHVPVPMAIGLRLSLLGWSWILLPAFVATFFAGQFTGGKIRSSLARQTQVRLGSFLLTDWLKILAAG